MRRRDNDSDQSSLELLLDTISNTFGGVLFMAILIAILLQMSGKPSGSQEEQPEIPQAELIALKQQLDAAIAERAALQEALKTQAATRDELRQEDLQPQVETLAALRAERDELQAKKLEQLAAISQSQVKVNELSEQISALDEQLAKARREAAAARAALKSEIESRTRATTLPKTRRSAKRELALIARYGRLYFIYNYSGPWSRTLNLEHMVVVDEDGSSRTLTPKPYAGLPLKDDGFKQELARRLKQHPARDWYVAAAVWSDSFAEFAHLRAALVELGHEYRLLLMRPGETLGESSIPNPVVQ
jgi:hypothetical protein